VRHAPTLNGDVDGSLQVLLSEGATMNGGAAISGDLLVPGLPSVILNGHPTYGGTLDGPGATTPTNFHVTLNSAVLRHVVRRIDPITMPAVNAPPAPTGTRNVALNNANQSAGDFATLRNLTLNSSAGVRAIPPGTYGVFVANGNSGFVLGVAGSTTPAIYNLQGLTLNKGTSLQIVGPVILTLANGPVFNSGVVGNANAPEWLLLRVASGGVTLNSSATLHGFVVAPSGTITINGALDGEVICDRLTVNGNGVLSDPDL
jgi:rhamnogalacturonan endolyase